MVMKICCTDCIFTQHAVHHKNTRHGSQKSEGGWKMMIFHDSQFANVTFLWICFFFGKYHQLFRVLLKHLRIQTHLLTCKNGCTAIRSVAHVFKKKKGDQVVQKFTPKKHIWEVVVCKPSCTDSKAIGPTDLASK